VPARSLARWLAAMLLVACTSPSAIRNSSPAASPGTGGSASTSTGANSARPNILVILTDDQRAGTLGVMPATSRAFVQGGTTFTNGFVTTPLCCPSRSSILSGRYAHNTGVHTNGQAQRLDQDTTIERYLRDAGYRTGIVGKFLNNWPLDRNPPHFDRWAVFNSGYYNTDWNVQGRQETVGGYSTDFIADEADRFLGAFERSDSVPWFLYVATSAPHDPWLPEPQHQRDPLPVFVKDPAMRETDRTDKPPWVRNSPRPSAERIAANRADQLRTLRSVDDMVASVFRMLHRLGEDRNTLAVFLSDNGFLWGDHGLAGDKGGESETATGKITGKRFPYTPSIQVPFLMRWPGRVAADASDSRLVANVDLAPTFLDAAGLSPDPNEPMDGHSLLGTRARRDLFLEYFLDPFYPLVPSWASIRTKDRQYIESFDREGQVVFREYYDLRRDPFELDNLLHDGDPSNDPDVSRLASEIHKEARCTSMSGPGACP
jgi:arylsulfatase A-like enzyme